MKTTFKPTLILSVLITLLAIFTSCNHNDDDYPNTIDQPLGEGTLTLNGESHTSNFAYALDYGTYPNTDNEKFVLVFADNVFDGQNWSNNTTYTLGIELSSENLDHIEDGDYYFSSNNWHPPFSISDANGYFNLIFQDGNIIDGDNYETIASGALTFNNSDNMVHITYEIEFASGDSIQGEYTGDIKYFTIDN